MDRTRLARVPFEWDNNTQGKCPESTEVLRVYQSRNVMINDLSMDGNGQHMAIRGYGEIDLKTGQITSGTPQFPSYSIGSSGSVLNVALSENLTIQRITILNAYGWAASLGQVKNLRFERNLIDTGNLSTNYKGHIDPWGNVMHVHSSQDGLHLVNVVNADIGWNTIYSEDSGIAVEANPAWNWWTFSDGDRNTMSREIRIFNNAVMTARNSSMRPAWTASTVLGGNLIGFFAGQGGVDIFYTADEPWGSDYRGTNARIQNITVKQNSLNGNRYGVRAGYFINSGPYDSVSPMHEIKGLIIENHRPEFVAGHLGQALAEITNISGAAEVPSTLGTTGGVGVLMRHVTKSSVYGNSISNVRGGIGIELVGTSNFDLINNRISNVRGTSLSSYFRWDAGEGIRIWNGISFDAGLSSLSGNIIDGVDASGEFIYRTKNVKNLDQATMITNYKGSAILNVP